MGSLILTLTLVPVLASYWFKSGSGAVESRLTNGSSGIYATPTELGLARPKLTMLVATAIFGVTLLLVPFIGGEFMPHLDEGALWVRATMPYTISFEEASRSRPDSRHPDVLSPGHGRRLGVGTPDDGTDPTGFFNVEFYVGLKPYDDKTWSGISIAPRQKLIGSASQEANSFPGIIFNFTQPAEDAVDEALTGLKSALAVKVYGADLNVLQDEACADQETLWQNPRLQGA